MKKINWKELGIDLAVDVAASIIIAVGIYNFAMSADFPVAGFSGIAIIMYHLLNIPVGVGTIHLENRTHGPGRQAQLETVLAAAERWFPRIPVILGGDLNTNTFDGRDKDAIQTVAGDPVLQRRCLEDVAAWEGCLTAAEAAGYRLLPEKPLPTRRKPLPGGGHLDLRLDWLLVRGARPEESRTVSTRRADCGFALAGSALAAFAGEELSDHNAVWASCRIPGGESQ